MRFKSPEGLVWVDIPTGKPLGDVVMRLALPDCQGNLKCDGRRLDARTSIEDLAGSLPSALLWVGLGGVRMTVRRGQGKFTLEIDERTAVSDALCRAEEHFGITHFPDVALHNEGKALGPATLLMTERRD